MDKDKKKNETTESTIEYFQRINKKKTLYNSFIYLPWELLDHFEITPNQAIILLYINGVTKKHGSFKIDIKQIAKYLKISKRAVNVLLADLKIKGLINRIAKGEYIPTSFFKAEYDKAQAQLGTDKSKKRFEEFAAKDREIAAKDREIAMLKSKDKTIKLEPHVQPNKVGIQ